MSPNGTTKYQSVSSTGTYTFTGFNGEDPSGTWYVYIISKGTVSTVKSGTLKVEYSYS